MKKNSLLTLLVAVCLAACTGEKVLERPAFKSATSPEIFPMKVELTKEATIVHFHMNSSPTKLGQNRPKQTLNQIA